MSQLALFLLCQDRLIKLKKFVTFVLAIEGIFVEFQLKCEAKQSDDILNRDILTFPSLRQFKHNYKKGIN